MGKIVARQRRSNEDAKNSIYLTIQWLKTGRFQRRESQQERRQLSIPGQTFRLSGTIFWEKVLLCLSRLLAWGPPGALAGSHVWGIFFRAAMLEFNKQVNASIVEPEFIVRVRKKLDQREASELFGGGVNAFSRYENGITKPGLALVQLLKLLDKHPELLTEIRTS